MNKWHLLLFSVYGLLEIASSDRNFIDGRFSRCGHFQQKSETDTGISAYKPYLISTNEPHEAESLPRFREQQLRSQGRDKNNQKQRSHAFDDRFTYERRHLRESAEKLNDVVRVKRDVSRPETLTRSDSLRSYDANRASLEKRYEKNYESNNYPQRLTRNLVHERLNTKREPGQGDNTRDRRITVYSPAMSDNQYFQLRITEEFNVDAVKKNVDGRVHEFRTRLNSFKGDADIEIEALQSRVNKKVFDNERNTEIRRVRNNEFIESEKGTRGYKNDFLDRSRRSRQTERERENQSVYRLKIQMDKRNVPHTHTDRTENRKRALWSTSRRMSDKQGLRQQIGTWSSIERHISIFTKVNTVYDKDNSRSILRESRRIKNIYGVNRQFNQQIRLDDARNEQTEGEINLVKGVRNDDGQLNSMQYRGLFRNNIREHMHAASERIALNVHRRRVSDRKRVLQNNRYDTISLCTKSRNSINDNTRQERNEIRVENNRLERVNYRQRERDSFRTNNEQRDEQVIGANHNRAIMRADYRENKINAIRQGVFHGQQRDQKVSDATRRITVIREDRLTQDIRKEKEIPWTYNRQGDRESFEAKRRQDRGNIRLRDESSICEQRNRELYSRHEEKVHCIDSVRLDRPSLRRKYISCDDIQNEREIEHHIRDTRRGSFVMGENDRLSVALKDGNSIHNGQRQHELKTRLNRDDFKIRSRNNLKSHVLRTGTDKKQNERRQRRSRDIIHSHKNADNSQSNVTRLIKNSRIQENINYNNDLRRSTTLNSERLIQSRDARINLDRSLRTILKERDSEKGNERRELTLEDRSRILDAKTIDTAIFVLSWQYVFYALQAIYLCSLFIKMTKNEGKTKSRITNWLTPTESVKMD